MKTIAALGALMAAMTAHATSEGPNDKPWADAVRAWEKDPSQTLEQVLPHLASQLKADASVPELKKLWGNSIGFDEGAKAQIIHDYILDDLEKTFGTHKEPRPVDSAGHRVAYAGLQHSYGYLLSNLDTAFGFKRARWVEGDIENGFGLEARLLNDDHGTLMSNVTLVAGRIGFSKSPQRLKELDAVAQHAAPTLRIFPAKPLQGKRLEESFTVGARQVVLLTDFVPFTSPQKNTKNGALLVYSVSDSQVDGGLPRLITAFPIELSFMQGALDPAKLGKDQPIVTRYNAFVPGVSGTSFKGSRTAQSNVYKH